MSRPLALILTPLATILAIAPAGAGAPPAKAPAATPAPAKLLPAYAEGQLAAARRHHQAGRHAQAIAAAREAATAFDAQVELHKALSEAVTPFELLRAERAAARQAAIARDEAHFLAATSARAAGDRDAAIRHYALVVQSQPDQPLGQQALAALAELGFLSSPQPTESPRS